MLYEANRERWGVLWRMIPSEYEPNPPLRVYIRDLMDREAAKHHMGECLKNPRCAAAAVVRITEVWDIEEAVPGRDALGNTEHKSEE